MYQLSNVYLGLTAVFIVTITNFGFQLFIRRGQKFLTVRHLRFSQQCWWQSKCSGTRRSVVRLKFPDVLKEIGAFIFKGWRVTKHWFQNVGNYYPSDKASHPRRPESSATLSLNPQISLKMLQCVLRTAAAAAIWPTIHAVHWVEFYIWWLILFNLLLECIKFTPWRWPFKGCNLLGWTYGPNKAET